MYFILMDLHGEVLMIQLLGFVFNSKINESYWQGIIFIFGKASTHQTVGNLKALTMDISGIFLMIKIWISFLKILAIQKEQLFRFQQVNHIRSSGFDNGEETTIMKSISIWILLNFMGKSSQVKLRNCVNYFFLLLNSEKVVVVFIYDKN
jgi:hypothetical protein